MNKLITLFILSALTLPLSVAAQPGDAEQTPGQRERADRGPRDGAQERNRERGERGDRERGPRDGDRPRDSERDRSPREPIAVEQVADAIATLLEMHSDPKPRWLERVQKQAEENPEEAAARLSRFPRLREMMDARANRPEEFALHASQAKLMREVFALRRQAFEARRDEDQAKLDELRPQLRERVAAVYEIRLKLKAKEIERLRQRLVDEEKELAELQNDRDTLIDEKLEELMEGRRGGGRGR